MARSLGPLLVLRARSRAGHAGFEAGNTQHWQHSMQLMFCQDQLTCGQLGFTSARHSQQPRKRRYLPETQQLALSSGLLLQRSLFMG